MCNELDETPILQKNAHMEIKDVSKDWLTIPILPCVSIVETLAFWEALGYTVTYKQTSPYQYGVVERGGYSLHFGYIKGMEATTNYYTGCLIMVQDATTVYKEFAGYMKQQFGKVPHTGIPRISRMKPGATRFTLTDVSGNSVIFVSYGKEDQDSWEETNDKHGSRMQKAIAVARRFRDYKNDDAMAAKTLDVALRRDENHDRLELAEALVMRMELAGAMGDSVRAGECQALLDGLSLQESELAAIKKKHETQ